MSIKTIPPTLRVLLPLFSLPPVLPATKDDPRQRKPDITTAKVQLGWEPKVQHTHTHTALGRQAHTYTHTYIHTYIHTHKYTHTLSHTRTDTHCRTEYFTYLLCDEVLILVSLEMHFSLNYFVWTIYILLLFQCWIWFSVIEFIFYLTVCTLTGSRTWRLG